MIDTIKNILEYLGSPGLAATVAVAIPAILKLASLIKLDTTKLPTWAQPIPGFLLALLAGLLDQLQSGATVKDGLLVLIFGWLGGIGVYHVGKRWTPSKASPAASKLAGSGIVLAVLTFGCIGSFEESKFAGLDPQARAAAAPPSERCMALDNEHRWWGGVAQTTAVLAGAEGISTWPIDGKNVETALAIGAGATAAVAAGSAYLSAEAGESWVRECSQ
jgi:hypothetical protein